MRLLYAGLNIHTVIPAPPCGPQSSEVVESFEPLPDLNEEPVEVLFICWSQLVVRSGARLIIRGHLVGEINDEAVADLSQVFGDHNGIYGGLTKTGQLYTITSGKDNGLSRLACMAQQGSPRLSHVAVAGNSRVVASALLSQDGDHDATHLEEFLSLKHFLAWYRAPNSSDATPLASHMLPGKLKQLVANETVFIALTENGKVYTWGDARHRALGRTPAADTPAGVPCPLVSLHGAMIEQIAAGGWNFAVLTDGMVLVWTVTSPGGEHVFAWQEDQATSGEMQAVTVLDAAGEPCDFDRVAVGDGHLLVKTVAGRVFGAGDNSDGQLGLSKEAVFFDDWVEICTGGASMLTIAGGGRSSMAVAE